MCLIATIRRSHLVRDITEVAIASPDHESSRMELKDISPNNHQFIAEINPTGPFHDHDIETTINSSLRLTHTDHFMIDWVRT